MCQFKTSYDLLSLLYLGLKEFSVEDQMNLFRGGWSEIMTLVSSNNISYICFLAVVRNVHCLFYMGLVGHSKFNLETRIPDFCLMGAKYF